MEYLYSQDIQLADDVNGHIVIKIIYRFFCPALICSVADFCSHTDQAGNLGYKQGKDRHSDETQSSIIVEKKGKGQTHSGFNVQTNSKHK